MPEVQFPMVGIAFERESIPIDTLTPTMVPDEKWRLVDSNGHGHFWEGEELPTLEWVVTGTGWVGDEYDGSEYEICEYRCRLCAEVVEPRRRPEYGPKFIPGLATFTVTINDEEFLLTDRQYADSVERWAEELRKVAAMREP